MTKDGKKHNKKPVPYLQQVLRIVARWRGQSLTDYRANNLFSRLATMTDEEREAYLARITGQPIFREAEEQLKKVEARRRKWLTG